MNVSPNELRKQTVTTLKQVDDTLESILEAATLAGIDPAKYVDQRGTYILPPLLLAKAQCLNTLVLLNEPRKR